MTKPYPYPYEVQLKMIIDLNTFMAFKYVFYTLFFDMIPQNSVKIKPKKYNTYCGFKPGFLLKSPALPLASTYNANINNLPLRGAPYRHDERERQLDAQEKHINMTVKALASYGLTDRYLRTNLKTLDLFLDSDTLIYLVTGKHPGKENMPVIDSPLTLAQAIREINDLRWSAILTLEKLYVYGLRGEHLRLFKPEANEYFSSQHGYMLVYLMRDKIFRLSANEAMMQINEVPIKSIEATFYKLPFEVLFQTRGHAAREDFDDMLVDFEQALSSCHDLQDMDLRFYHLDKMTTSQLQRLWKSLAPFGGLQNIYLDYNEIYEMTDEQFKTLLDCTSFGVMMKTLLSSNDRAVRQIGSKLLALEAYNFHKYLELEYTELLNISTIIKKALDTDNAKQINLLRDLVIHIQALNINNGIDIDANLQDFYDLLLAKNQSGDFTYRDLINNFEFVFKDTITRLHRAYPIYTRNLIDSTPIDPSVRKTLLFYRYTRLIKTPPQDICDAKRLRNCDAFLPHSEIDDVARQILCPNL